MKELPKYSINWTQPYRTWYGSPMSKVDWMLKQSEIIQDNLIEYDLERSKLNEAKEVLDRIKNL